MRYERRTFTNLTEKAAIGLTNLINLEHPLSVSRYLDSATGKYVVETILPIRSYQQQPVAVAAE